MAMTLERPPTVPEPELDDESPPQLPRLRRRTFWERYRQHIVISLITLLGLGAALLPTLLAPGPRIGGTSAQPATAAPATNIALTASDFKFSPSSVQVPLGQKVTFTLRNAGAVEHDVTMKAAGFALTVRPGQTAAGE